MTSLRKSITALCIGVLLLSMIHVANASEPIVRLFDRAKEYESKGDYSKALTVYSGIIEGYENDPRIPVAAMAMGNIQFLEMENPGQAIDAYDIVVTSYSDSKWGAEAARRKGECFRQLEQWDEARESFGEALKLSGGSTEPVSDEWINEVSLSAADCAFETGDRSGVIETYEDVLRSDPAPHTAASIRFRLAESYLSTGDSSLAASNYAEIITAYPFSQVFDQAMEQKGLISRFEEIPWEPYTEYAQTTRDFATRDFEHALELSESVLKKTENDVLKTCATYRAIVAQTMLTGDFSDGAARLDSLLSRLEDPRTMPNALQQLDRFTVVSQQERDIQQDPENVEKHMILGQTYLQYGNAAQAVTVLTKAKELGGEDATIDLLLGFGHATMGETELADSSFMRYLENNPEDALTLNRIGYTFLGQGLTERALYYFQRYVAVAPDDPNAHDSYGEGLLNAGRVDEAAREYERAIELDETFANSYLMLGTAYRQLDEQEKSRLMLEEFLRLSPEGPQADQARQMLVEIEGNNPGNQ